jgi:hypothetical protein
VKIFRIKGLLLETRDMRKKNFSKKLENNMRNFFKLKNFKLLMLI